MHLSRLILNPQHAQARRDLAAPYELHKTLSNAFGDAPEGLHRATHGVLFRVEEAGRGGVPVLVQSTSAPAWKVLPAGYVLRLDGPKAFAPTFAEGQRLRFRLVANPVRRERIEGKRQPRRAALVHPRAKEGVEAGYLDWLDRQAGAAGFAVMEVADVPFRLAPKRRVTNDPDEIQAVERGDREGITKPRIPHFGVLFDGVLRVVEPEKLTVAVRKGIGPAKAFGFGLLSLARAS